MKTGSLLETVQDAGGWICAKSNKNVSGPSKGDYVIHDGVCPDDESCILLVEYPHICECGCGGRGTYPEYYFREVQPPMDIKIEDIISEPVTQ